MPISEHQLEKCLEVMNKISRWKISKYFFIPLEQESEILPENFSSIITNKIDLSIVQMNLKNRKYNTVLDWKNDVNIIWKNFYALFRKNDLQYLMAKQLQEAFDKLTESISDNVVNDWEIELSNLRDNFLSISKNGPNSIFGVEENAPPAALAAPKKKSTASTKNKKKTSTNQENSDTQTGPTVGGDQVTELSNFSNEQLQDYISKLQDDINKVGDEDSMTVMIKIISENEPHFHANENEDVEVDLRFLSKKTLFHLRQYVDTLLAKNPNPTS